MKSYLQTPRAVVDAPWSIPEVCASYGVPAGTAAGRGVIAIVELGGGWNQTDVDAAFAKMGLPAPSIVDVSVDGTMNAPGAPGAPGEADAEVALDIQVAGGAYAMATGVAATIRMYWSKSIPAAVERAAADGCDVCSISWGSPEEDWGKDAVLDMERAATAASLVYGMAVFAAAGDNDADDGDAAPSVDCPACCPHVVGCGGTSKPRGGPEVVWNNNPGQSNGSGTGGGYSAIFPMEPWQSGAPIGPAGLGRMVPDVAAVADPYTGFELILNGAPTVIGGTSGVAPLYAGIVAAVWGKRPGWLGPDFYGHPQWFTNVLSGDNGTYTARVGPDACTGLGVPNVGVMKT
jgi:kumamolisin